MPVPYTKKHPKGRFGRPRLSEKERTVICGGFTVTQSLKEEFSLMADFLGLNKSEHFMLVAERYLKNQKLKYGVGELGDLFSEDKEKIREENRQVLADYLEEKREKRAEEHKKNRAVRTELVEEKSKKRKERYEKSKEKNCKKELNDE